MKPRKPRRPGGKPCTPDYFAGRDDERAAVLRELLRWEDAFKTPTQTSAEDNEQSGAIEFVRERIAALKHL